MSILRLSAGLAPLPGQPGCPAPGEPLPSARIAAGAGRIPADLDCDGDVDPVDALGALRHAASLLPIQQQPGCPEFGAFYFRDN